MAKRKFSSFSEFYAFYLKEHDRRGTRIFHVIGTLGWVSALIWTLFGGDARSIPLGIVFAYGMAWTSHFMIEKNRPATFKWPLYSLISDFRMMAELLTGRIGWGKP